MTMVVRTMKLLWAEIRNFRSIKESGRIYFNERITILAGKNESGKSNILKALHSFSLNKFDSEYDYPLESFSDEAVPEVSLCFKLETEDYEKLHIKSSSLKNLSDNIIVTRRDKSSELIESEILQSMTKNLKTNVLAEFLIMKEQFEKIDKIIDTKFHTKIIEEDFDGILSAFDELKEYLEDDPSLLNNSDEYGVLFENLSSRINKYENDYSDLRKIREVFSGAIPNFIYFNSFEDIIPNFISNQDNSINLPIVQRFFKVAELDPNTIFKENSSQRRKLITDRVSAQVTGDFMGYYSQDKVSLKINLDGNQLNFFVYGEDEQKPFQPKQRSQGLQWFMAFYLTLLAEQKKGSILLIDEPGLYLHAMAQEDLLKMLEKISETSPVVFSTHSQWLIDPSRLERLRLVLKVGDNTFVENKIHKGADNITMKPIISAIGLEFAKDISRFNTNVLLVEGYSDYYYLEALRVYFKRNSIISSDFQIYPCLGVSQIINVLTLLVDSISNYLILLDNDKAGRVTAKRLREECGIDEDKIIFSISSQKQDNSVIEDLFSEMDYKTFIGLDSDAKGKKSDKVLEAKKFNEKIHADTSIKLSQETISNFKVIFELIASRTQGLSTVN